MNTRSLSFRLVTWYAGVLTFVFVVLGALTLFFLRHYLEAGVLDTQARRAHQIADTLLAAIDETGEAGVARQVEDLYSPEANDRFIRITRNAAGSTPEQSGVVYVSGAPRDGSFIPSTIPIPSREVWSGRRDEWVRKEVLPSGSVLVAAVARATSRGERYVVEVGISTVRTEATLGQVLLLLAIGLPVAVCIAVVGGFILVRRALKPVDGIARKAEKISQHHLSRRLPVLIA